MNRTKIHEPSAKPWTINQGLTISTIRSSRSIFQRSSTWAIPGAKLMVACFFMFTGTRERSRRWRRTGRGGWRGCWTGGWRSVEWSDLGSIMTVSRYTSLMTSTHPTPSSASQTLCGRLRWDMEANCDLLQEQQLCEGLDWLHGCPHRLYLSSRNCLGIWWKLQGAASLNLDFMTKLW